MNKFLLLSVFWFAVLGGIAEAQSGAYFSGDGGKGKRLAILVPEGRGIAKDDDYLPTMAQGVFVADMTKYSAIDVLDRLNLEKVLAESESGIYKSEADFVQLGEITNVGYAMTGSITKTGSGYALQMQVTETKTGKTSASYAGSCSIAEFDNFTGIKKASLELLTQMGIALNDQAKKELSGADSEQAVNAQTALAKGVTSQKSGTVVEALSYYIQANSYDQGLAEAAGRLNVLAANVSSGNIGMDVRNDIAWRKQWTDRLKEGEDFYANYTKENPPYYIVYSTDIKQGKIDYKTETVSLSINISSVPDLIWFMTINKIIYTLRDGVNATGRTKDWQIDWPKNSISSKSPFVDNRKEYAVTLEIINDKGTVIGKQVVNMPYGWSRLEQYYYTGKTVERSSFFKDVTFNSVNANLITDNLQIRVSSVDGISAERAAKEKHVSIMTESDFNNMPRAREYNWNINTLPNFISTGQSRNDYSFQDHNTDVLQRGGENFSGIIPYGVTELAHHPRYISLEKFARVEIPSSVISAEVTFLMSSKGTLVMPANVRLDGSDSNRNRFAAYNNGKRAGTYMLSSGPSGKWVYIGVQENYTERLQQTNSAVSPKYDTPQVHTLEQPTPVAEQAAHNEEQAEEKDMFDIIFYRICPTLAEIGYVYEPCYPTGIRIGFLLGLTLQTSDSDFQETQFTIGFYPVVIDKFLRIPIGAGARYIKNEDGNLAYDAFLLEVGVAVTIKVITLMGTYRFIDFKENSFTLGACLTVW